MCGKSSSSDFKAGKTPPCATQHSTMLEGRVIWWWKIIAEFLIQAPHIATLYIVTWRLMTGTLSAVVIFTPSTCPCRIAREYASQIPCGSTCDSGRPETWTLLPVTCPPNPCGDHKQGARATAPNAPFKNSVLWLRQRPEGLISNLIKTSKLESDDGKFEDINWVRGRRNPKRRLKCLQDRTLSTCPLWSNWPSYHNLPGIEP